MQLRGLLAEQRALHRESGDARDDARGLGLQIRRAQMPQPSQVATSTPTRSSPATSGMRERRDLDLARGRLARAGEAVGDLRDEARLLRAHDGSGDLQLGIEQAGRGRPCRAASAAPDAALSRVQRVAPRRSATPSTTASASSSIVLARAAASAVTSSVCSEGGAGAASGAGRGRRNRIEGGIGTVAAPTVSMDEGCDGSGTRKRYATSTAGPSRELGLPGIALMEMRRRGGRPGRARALRRRRRGERAVRARQQRRRRLRRRPPPARRRVSRVGVCVDAAAESTTDDARTMRAAAAAFGVPERAPEDADVIVDALFGSGFRGRLEGAAEALVTRVNGLAAPIVALDVPSGVDGASGRVEGTAIRGRADARVPRADARHGDRAGPRPRGRGRSSCRSACRARSPGPRGPCAWSPPTSRSCRRARPRARSTTRAACSSSADRRA